MASVTSQSSRGDVLNAMVDNASYDEDNSLPKAKAFVTACKVWLVRWAFDKSRQAHSEISMPTDLVQKQLEAAQAWVASQPAAAAATSGNVLYASVENFRS
jgi:hypothetical protein